MVDVQKFQTQEEVIRPELSKPASEEERKKRLENAADVAMTEMDKFMEASDVGGFALGSNFENTRFQVWNTKSKIFDVLAKAGTTYEKNLGAESGLHSQLESYAWGKSGEDTMKSIKNRGRGANESLLVAEGFDGLLESSVSSIQKEWTEREAIAKTYLEQRGFWSKMGGLGRKIRFEKFSAKFKKEIEKSGKEIQTSIDLVKRKKKLEVAVTERKIKAAFANSDDADKQTLWRDISEKLKDTTVNISGLLRRVGIVNEQDFIEACMNLGYVDQVENVRYSETLGLNADKKLENYEERETKLRSAPNYEALQKKLGGLSVKPADDNVEIKDVVKSIEADLINNKVDLLADVFGATSIEGIFESEKVVYFINFLNSGDNYKNLDIKTQRKLLKYLNQQSDTSLDDYENIDLSNQVDDNLESSKEWLDKLMNGGGSSPLRPNFTAVNGILNVNGVHERQFSRLNTNIETVLFELDKYKDHYDKKENQDQLSDEDKERTKEKWEKIIRIKEAVIEAQKKWEKEKEDHKGLRDRMPKSFPDGSSVPKNNFPTSLTRWQLGFSTEKTRLESLIAPSSGLPPDAAVKSRLETELAALIAKSAEYKDLKEDFDDFEFSDLDSFNFDMLDLASLVIERPISRPTTIRQKSLNQRIHDKLIKEFKNDAEKEYLSFLEGNSKKQWDILQNASEGVKVNLSFRDTTNVSQLQMPSDLQTNKSSVLNLRVIRKEENRVILEDANNIYVLQGASAENGKAVSNLGVFTKMNTAGRAVSGTILPPDFTILNKSPNQEGIVLSMSVH